MKRKKIKTGWLEYFNFTTRERRGAIFLSVLLLLQIVILYCINNFHRKFPPPDEKIMQAILAAQRANDTLQNINSGFVKPLLSDDRHQTENIQTVNNKPQAEFRKQNPGHLTTLKSFDPNSIRDSSVEIPGLSKKQIKVICHYLSRGGKFYVKSDFKKMYCINENNYKKLEPYIQLPDSLEKKIKFKSKDVSKPILVDINKIDSTGMLVIRGIGPILASRIIRYRDKLGGFTSLVQLKDVWGINDTIYQNLLPAFILKDTIPFRFIHLNTDSFSVLSAHPYLKSNIAGLICKFRKHHPFVNVDELKHLPLITDENFRKLVPYLKAD